MSRSADAEKARAWRRRLERFDVGDQSVVAFCRREQVSQATFYYWRRRLKFDRSLEPDGRGATSSLSSQSQFQPVRLSMATVELHLPNGVRVLIPSGEIRALEVAVEAASRCSRSVVEDD